jgi:leucyl aminopeptidase
VKLKISGPDATSLKADLLAVCVFQGEKTPAGEWSPAADRQLRTLLGKSGFSGKAGSVQAASAPSSFAAPRLLLIGLGKEGKVQELEVARRAAGTFLGKLAEHGAASGAFVAPGSSAGSSLAAAEGVLLAEYSFTRHQSEGSGSGGTKTLTLAVPAKAKAAVQRDLKMVTAIARGTCAARDFGNEPSNIMTPVEMARRAKAMARKRAKDGLSCKILGPAEIKKQQMGAFLAVAQGSEIPPRFIHLVYKPKGASKKRKRVAIVGKGLTFDSGGISIKPAGGMEDMKFDMCGSATVLGLFEALPDLGVQHEVHGFIATCDNMPSGSAYKPGDVVTSMAGRTIEVLNTDAEGRLTLVDAITYALKTKPDVMVDLATLTGACAIALGSATGIMANDHDLEQALMASAEETGDRSWPLPLFEDYKSQLVSSVADVKNLGERFGGALTAGLFLSLWVPEDLPWAHMDIAGSGWAGSNSSLCPKGATGTGVRTLGHWLRHLGG